MGDAPGDPRGTLAALAGRSRGGARAAGPTRRLCVFRSMMKFGVDFFEMDVGQVGVDLGGGNRGMAEELLDLADIGAVA